jgi:acid phosphatase type 7
MYFFFHQSRFIGGVSYIKNIFGLTLLTFIFNHVGFSQSIIVNPYLQDASTSTMTIMWETDQAGLGGVIYGTTPFGLDNEIASTASNSNGTKYIHTTTITNLLSNTKYYYKAFTQSGTLSNLYTFITSALPNQEADLSFIAMSDIQRDASNPGVYQSLINNGVIPVADSTIAGGYKSLTGLLIPGDLVQDGGNYNTWKTDFFDLGDSVTPYVPMYPVLGNHEYYNGGSAYFVKYFTLPLNGSGSNPDEWWYKDVSNVRIIGLNTNSTSATLNTQLVWLESVLDNAATLPNIDFVIAQFHHPFKSELWTPGELPFVGNFISKLETFSANTGKPSMHCFGHTHAYSRGTSRDHNHLWLNVAVAGGAIDNWGEYPNNDYTEFSISEDEYGFVLIQTEAGLDPKIRIRRFSRGDQYLVKNNVLSDELVISRYEHSPSKPSAIYPVSNQMNPQCVTLKATDFEDGFKTHQASHWQLSPNCNFVGPAVINLWEQSTNWYNEVNTQASDNLTDQKTPTLEPLSSYCWRVRYRNQFNKWSDWSESTTFSTTNLLSSPNLLINAGAEEGTIGWSGNIESLTSNECNSVPVYSGTRFFAVGGVCVGVSNPGIASQLVDVTPYSVKINDGIALAEVSGYVRSYATNNDHPEFYLEFYDINNVLLSTSPTLSNNTPFWLPKSGTFLIPINTTSIKLVLRGVFISGSDNDSYYDALSLKILENNCPSCVGDPINANYVDSDGDGICQSLDCNDNNASISPGKLELCDFIDNNCDGLVDSGPSAIWSGSGGDNLWHNPANWTQNMVPLPCQHVSLANNITIILNDFAAVRSLTIQPGSHLTITATGELNVHGQEAIYQSAISVQGTLTNSGKIKADGATQRSIYISGNFHNQTSGYIEVKGGSNDMEIVTSGVMNNQGEIRIRN